MSKAKFVIVLTALVAIVGCKSTLTSWLRTDPVPLTDFLPDHDKLRRMDDTCPFHYHWCDVKALIAANLKHIYIAGQIGGFFVPCLGMVTSAISSGTIAVESRARIGKDGPIVAMLADTESDPSAIIPFSKLTWTTPAKINLKRIAMQTASTCTVDKMEDLDRGYPIEFISTFSDADLDDM